GLTQEELAERAGLSSKGISALERGERQRPHPHTVRALASALDVSDQDRAALFGNVRSGGGLADNPPLHRPAQLPLDPPDSKGRHREVARIAKGRWGRSVGARAGAFLRLTPSLPSLTKSHLRFLPTMDIDPPPERETRQYRNLVDAYETYLRRLFELVL